MSRVTTGREQQAGRLATHKADFNAHVDGTAFRQLASTVDIAAIENVTATNVQEALESVTNLITSAGSGFISIGLADGYAQGSYTVGSVGYDSLRDAFYGAFADPRLTNGGVVLVLAGTYTTSATITVPSGITILGEMGGTIIVGEMADVPMFQIEGTSSRIKIGGNDGLGDLSMDSAGKPEGVKFVNLMLIDNLDGYAAFGAPSMTSVPMIRCSVNSNLTCEQVRFVGRLAQGSAPRVATYGAIGYSAGSSSGTHLNVYKCFFDGIQTPIRFTPAGGVVDSLRVESCRARVIGADDDAANGVQDLNCFLTLSGCNAAISNNYVYPGPHTYLESMIYITAVYSGNSKIVLTGNHGYSSDVSPGYGALVGGVVSSISFSIMQHGNNWGGRLGEWYVVAGYDFIGSSALDSILNSNLDSSLVYVYGNYTVTHAGLSSLKLIGIASPIISLNVTTGTDTFSGNRRFQISYAENIIFKCDITKTAVYHTVLAYRDQANQSMAITNCLFDNCALVVFREAGDTFKTLSVKNCRFIQNGVYAANVSMLVPAANTTVVDNCYFNLSGGGYAGGVGEAGAYVSTPTNCNVLVSNCIISLNNGLIDTAAPLSMNHFFWVSENNSKVTIDNCKIIANEEYRAFSSLISAAFLAAGTIKQFVYIKARDITIINSLFNAPDAGYVTSGIGYALCGLYLEPQTSATVTNTKFQGGALLLQIGGVSAFTGTVGTGGGSTVKNGGIVISECDFVGGEDYAYTLLDIDIDQITTPTYIPRISVEGNYFRNFTFTAGSEVYQVRHTASTGSHYEIQGIVQIYANLTDITVANNKVFGTMLDLPHGTFLQYAGLVVNNISGDVLSGTKVVSSLISNNSIYLQTDYAAAVGLDAIGVATLNVKSSIANINNNYITMYFSGAETNTSYLECLRLNCDSVAGYGDSIVSNNIFSIRNDAGVAGMLKSYYVNLSPSTAKGSFVNNSFSDKEFLVTSLTTSLEPINDSNTGWYIFGNKNHQKTVTVTNGTGNFSVADTGNILFGRVAGTTVGNSYISSAADGGKDLVFNLGDAALCNFTWVIPGSALPYGVTVTKAVLRYQLSSLAGITENLTVSIISEEGSEGTAAAIATTAPAVRTTSAALTHTNYPENNVRVVVRAGLGNTSGVTLTISALEITYKW